MKSKHSERIMDELSLKYNLPKRVVKYIIMSQYEFLRDSMKIVTPGEFETFVSVRLKSFGIWKVRPGIVRAMGDRHKTYQERRIKKMNEKYESLHNKEQ